MLWRLIRTGGTWLAARDVRIATLVFAALLAIFLVSPIHQLTDSLYSMLLAEHLLTEQSLELDEYFAPAVDSRGFPGTRTGDPLPRHVQHGGERRGRDRSAPLYYIYPHASSILSVPLVAVSRLAGYSTVDENGRYDVHGEERIQAFWAAFLMAGAGAIFFLTARLLLPIGPSLLVAGTSALGSQVWSTASRGMWMHTWALLLLTIAAYLLLRAECGRGRHHLVLLATLLSWCFFVRPTAVLYIPPIALLILLQQRKRFWIFAATGLTWFLLFIAYNERVFGSLIPNYFTRGKNMGPTHWGDGLSAGLISPSRGLLVFLPWVLMIGYGLIVYRRQLGQRRLVGVSLLAFVAHVLVLGSFRGWHAGECYGARYSTDILPLIVVLAIAALAAALAGGRDHPGGRLRRPLEATILLLLVTVAVLLNGTGAISGASARWNGEPTPIGKSRERIFDWKRSQWMVALFPELLERGTDDRH
jgi:hypothetical protein